MSSRSSSAKLTSSASSSASGRLGSASRGVEVVEQQALLGVLARELARPLAAPAPGALHERQQALVLEREVRREAAVELHRELTEPRSHVVLAALCLVAERYERAQQGAQPVVLAQHPRAHPPPSEPLRPGQGCRSFERDLEERHTSTSISPRSYRCATRCRYDLRHAARLRPWKVARRKRSGWVGCEPFARWLAAFPVAAAACDGRGSQPRAPGAF